MPAKTIAHAHHRIDDLRTCSKPQGGSPVSPIRQRMNAETFGASRGGLPGFQQPPPKIRASPVRWQQPEINGWRPTACARIAVPVFRRRLVALRG
jgi:hypothetical protein